MDQHRRGDNKTPTHMRPDKTLYSPTTDWPSLTVSQIFTGDPVGARQIRCGQRLSPDSTRRNEIRCGAYRVQTRPPRRSRTQTARTVRPSSPWHVPCSTPDAKYCHHPEMALIERVRVLSEDTDRQCLKPTLRSRTWKRSSGKARYRTGLTIILHSLARTQPPPPNISCLPL